MTTNPNDPVPAHLADETPSPSTPWEWVVFIFKMAEIRLRFVAILAVMGLVIGNWETIKVYWERFTRPIITAAASGLTNGMEFFCPMHPNVVRNTLDPDGAVPKCPICGMPLSKRKKGEAVQLPPGVVSRAQFSPERLELGGIQTVSLTQQPLVRSIRTFGTVEFDESRVARIVSRVEGYIERLFVNESFRQVKSGEPLAEIYSPELYNAVQELLLAKRSGNQQLVDLGRDKLRLLRVDDREIDEALRSGSESFRLTLRSPLGGHLTRKEVFEGDRVMPGQMLFEVADLSQVWIEAEFYEKDIDAVQRGMKLEATLEAYPNRPFVGTVELVHPHLEADRRTLRVRARFDNPNHDLLPGMFASVLLEVPISELEPFKSMLAQSKATPPTGDDATLIAYQKVCPVTGFKLGSMGTPVRTKLPLRDVMLCCEGCGPKIQANPGEYLARFGTVSDKGVLAVPEHAVIDTGEQKIVYVEREPGTFEGVEVKLGPRSEGYYAVIDGLLPGDKVASSGAFLVDAETRLNPAASAAYFGASGSPQSGKAGSSTESESPDKSNSPQAARKLPTAKDLAEIAKLPEADRKLALAQGTCPITKAALGSMGVPVKVMLEGKPVFLCCKGCVQDATRNAKTVLEKVTAWQREASADPHSDHKK